MDKKTKTIVIVILAIVVICGAYYGFNRWRQQRLANQILQNVYGVNAGLLGGLTTGKTQEQFVKEMAKQAAEDEAKRIMDEAKEAAKTPADKYNEAEEMPTYDANSQAMATMFKDIVDKVFGQSKLTSISTSVYGSDTTGSGMLEFKTVRLATGADLAALNKVLANKGLTITQSSMSDKTASVLVESDKMTAYISFEIGKQTVEINAVKVNQ